MKGKIGFMFVLGALLLLAMACGAQATATPIPTPVPTPTKISTPVPAAVTLKAEQVILPDTEFPLTGYRVSVDQQEGSNDWSRVWAGESASAFSWVRVEVYVLAPSRSAIEEIAQTKCDWTFTPPPKEVYKFKPSQFGDGAVGCTYDFEIVNKGMSVFVYTTGTRNVLVHVGVGRQNASKATAETFAASLADYQLWIVDQVAPRLGVALRPSPKVQMPVETPTSTPTPTRTPTPVLTAVPTPKEIARREFNNIHRLADVKVALTSQDILGYVSQVREVIQRIDDAPAVQQEMREFLEQALGQPFYQFPRAGGPKPSVLVAVDPFVARSASFSPHLASISPAFSGEAFTGSVTWEMIKAFLETLIYAPVPGGEVVQAADPQIAKTLLIVQTRTEAYNQCFSKMDKCLSGNDPAFNKVSEGDFVGAFKVIHPAPVPPMPQVEVFAGSFSGPVAVITGVGILEGCRFAVSLSGTITLTLQPNADVTIGGSARIPTTVASAATGGSEFINCINETASLTFTGALSGNRTGFSGVSSVGTHTMKFSGVRNGNLITGSIAVSFYFPGGTASGTLSNIVLNRQ